MTTRTKKLLPTEQKALWEKKNPDKVSKTHKHLTPQQKADAKARAKRAGRHYPNMVDNMAALHAGSGRKKTRKAA